MSEILIVQDEPIVNEMIYEMLSRQGYKAKCVRSADEAVNFLLDHSPAVIISDELKLLESISGSLPYAFVMLSNSNDSEKIAKALRLGALDFNAKNDHETLVEKSFVWFEIGKRLKCLSTAFDSEKQKRVIELFRKKCSAFQEIV
jgi:CheY-like chemotaxis protein